MEPVSPRDLEELYLQSVGGVYFIYLFIFTISCQSVGL